MSKNSVDKNIPATIGTGVVVEDDIIISIDPAIHGYYLYYILCVEKSDKGKLLAVRVMGAGDILDMAREYTEATSYVIWYSPTAMALLSPVEETTTTTLANIGASVESVGDSNE